MLHWYHKRCCLYLFSLELSDSSSFGGVLPYCILLHVDSASQSLDVVLVSINQLFAVESKNRNFWIGSMKNCYDIKCGFYRFQKNCSETVGAVSLPFFTSECSVTLKMFSNSVSNSAGVRTVSSSLKPTQFRQFLVIQFSIVSMSYLLSSRDCKCSQSALALAFNLSTSKWSILSGLRRSARIFFLRSRSVPRPFLRS